MEISCLFAPNHHCCWNITASVATINVLNEEQAPLNNIKREMVTSNFSLFLSCLLMCVFIFNRRPAWVPHCSAASPAGGEELAWLEGAAKSRRSILFWVTGSREVSSWPEVVIYLVGMTAAWTQEWVPTCKSVLHGQAFRICCSRWNPCYQHRLEAS